MALSNAEHQRRWRAKHKAEVERLREAAAKHPLQPVLDAFEDRLVGELAKAAYERRQTNDRLDLVMRELLKLKRALGQVETPHTPRIWRRRPLGHD